MDSDLERIGRSFEMSPHPTIICNSKGIIVYANRAASRVYPAAIRKGDRNQWTELVSVHDTESGDRLPHGRYPMSLALAGKVTKERILEIRDQAKGKSFRVSIDAHPIKDDSGKIIGGIAIHHLLD